MALATEARLSDFVTELRARVAPVSAAMMLCALVRMLSALEPDRVWGPLARVYIHLRQTAAPLREKFSRLMPASDLFELGISLMESCEEADRPQYAAIRYRDGQIELRTRQAFGTAIWPHLFRDCAVTELVDCAPEEIGVAPDLLGHADLRTTRRPA